MIALITALVVMLAATLLIGLTQRMVSSYSSRLAQAQVSLSEASAADGLARLIELQGTGGLSREVSFQLAGVETRFTLIEQGTAGIRNGFYPVENAREAVVIPAGTNLVTAAVTGPGLVSVVIYSDRTFQPVALYTIETGMTPVAGAGITGPDGTGAVVLLTGGGETAVCTVTAEGITTTYVQESIHVPGNAFLTAGYPPSGQPHLIVTNGFNHGVYLNAATGGTEHIVSPPGTSPVFMPGGSVFGTPGGAVSSIGASRVRDVLGGDFNNDGVPDMAFAAPFSLTVFSGATGELFTARPGGSLICWGDVQGRNGLAAMWSQPGGGENWLRLGYQGFTGFVPEPMYRMGWEGRFTGSGNTFAGFIGGAGVVASSSGYIQELLTGAVFTGNADGGQLDFFLMGPDGLEAFFNPVDGDGSRLVFQAENTYRGETLTGNVHLFSIYGTGSGRRVFHSLEGESR